MAGERVSAEKDEVFDSAEHEHQCAADDCPNAAQMLDSSLNGGDGDYVCFRHYHCTEAAGCPALTHFEGRPALSSSPPAKEADDA